MDPFGVLNKRDASVQNLDHGGRWALLWDHSNTKITRSTTAWYMACSAVSGVEILDTKVAIVRRGDGATFAKKRGICPGAGDSNERIRRWRHPHLSQT